MGLSGLKLNCQQGCTPFASKGNAALNKAFFFFFFFFLVKQANTGLIPGKLTCGHPIQKAVINKVK